MGIVPLSPETRRRLDALFALDERSEAERLLAEKCGNGLPFLEKFDMHRLERFRYAALKLSKGSLDQLKVAVELANQDWRDLLMAPGFGEDVTAHERWFPSPSGD